MAEVRPLSVNDLWLELTRHPPGMLLWSDGAAVIGVDPNGPYGGIEIIVDGTVASYLDAIEEVQAALIDFHDTILKPKDGPPPLPLPAVVAMGKLVEQLRIKLYRFNPSGDEDDYIPF